MSRISEWIADFKEKQIKKRQQHVIEDSKNVVQIKEHNGEVWLVHHHTLICPMSRFKNDDVIECLNDLRNLYIVQVETELKKNWQ